jgi:amino acid transporter
VVYLMLLIAYVVRRKSLSHLHKPGAFTLGKWATPVFVLALIWLVVALLVLSVPAAFHQADVVVAALLVAGLLWYFLVLRRRIRAGKAGVERITATDQRLDASETRAR